VKLIQVFQQKTERLDLNRKKGKEYIGRQLKDEEKNIE
jgi:hypothetical protein